MLQNASIAFKSLNLFLSVITLENSSVFPKSIKRRHTKSTTVV